MSTKQDFEASVATMIEATPENLVISEDGDTFNGFINIIKEATHFGALSENAKELLLKEDRFFEVSGACDDLDSLEVLTTMQEINSNSVLPILKDIEETARNPFGA